VRNTGGDPVNKLTILILLLLSAFPAFSEEPSGASGGATGASALQEVGGELVTPRGNIRVGMKEENLYGIFQEQDRILIPQIILNKESHVFRDFTSKNRNDTVTFYINAGEVAGWKRGYASSPENKGSKYEYNNDERIDIWFFPKEKARWDGSRVNLLDWHKLSKAQKVTFILEYVKQINGEYNTNISVDVDKYILGMDYFNDNCPASCSSISASDAVNNLLISDGKAKEAPTQGK